ncbi:MAG: glycoside hydrolase family 1 protein [Clostridia bacterium]|nr:glycoside hydrolase family 1 protein [Clostridia bacterium]
MRFKLKEGLLLGSATAATQIEGGDENNNWARFAAEGKVKDGSSPVTASGHYTRVREDIDLMAEMGLEVYRFGIEWSRIEPRRGEYDAEAIEHYREEIEYMTEKGIKPLLTIHHFTNPLWFEDMGAFENDDSPEIFLSFTKKVVEAFGDIVSEYITINEPNVYATNSLLWGYWPPEKKSMGALVNAFSNMTAAHVLSYNYIHEKRREMGYDDTRVSFANHLRVFEPKNPKNPFHRIASSLSEYLFQGAITEAMMTGKCAFPVLRRKGVKKGKYHDFIGINYYSRSSVSGLSDGVREDCYKNDLGWEIYHEGLIELANKLGKKYGGEVYVTENGTCDNTDSFRARFVYDQLKMISEAENPITRYYHWSFMDNFEWKEGERERFGLVHVDYATQKRTVKESGRLYSSIIKNGGVTDEAYEEFVKNSHYKK